MTPKNYQYIGLAALNLFILSPLLHSIGVGKGFYGIYDPVVLWNILSSVTFLFALHIIFKNFFVVHLILLPLYITTLADLYLIFFYDSRLNASYLWIVLTNPHDALDYIEDFRGPMLVGIVAFLAFYTVCLWSIYRLCLNVFRRRLLASLSLSMLALLYVGLAARQTFIHDHVETFARGFADILEFDVSAPAGVFSQGASVYLAMRRHRFDQGQREDFVFGAERQDIEQPEVYVFVIGESARPDRLSLNGYHRDTTPNLGKISNLISYKDVVCEWPITQYSVPMMLSQATAEDFSRALKEKSLVTTFNEADFETHWISNQPFSYYGGFIHVLAGEADFFRYMNRVHDEAMLKVLDGVLADATTGPRKIFIVLHTLGSHQSYTNRYPPEFAVFDDSAEGLTRRELINNTFDNSIVYTDFFLSQVIGRLDALDVAASMTYVSDHGENLLDDERNLLGHGFNNEYDYPIPMLLWYSDEYETIFPDKVENAKRNIEKKIDTTNVVYSVADMAGISFDSFQPDMSFFNDAFTTKPRIVYRRSDDQLLDYDAAILNASPAKRRQANEAAGPAEEPQG